MSIPSSVLYYPIGFLYLWIRYRNKERVKKVLHEKYDGAYYLAGASIFLNVVGVILTALIIALLLSALFGIFMFSD